MAARKSLEQSGEDHSADRAVASLSQPAPSFIKNTREESSELFLAPGIREHRIRRKKHAQLTPWHGSVILLLISLAVLCFTLPRQFRKFSFMGILATIAYLRLWMSFHTWVKCSVIDSRKPKKIILIRHGESLGNVDKNVYARIPDNRVPLSEKGKREAEEAGKTLRNLIGDDTARFFVSPYVRSQQTFEHILKGGLFSEKKYTVREDARLREQDFGNLQVPQDMDKALGERKVFGAFYYRFPNGESGADVYDRVTSFWASLMREFKYQHCLEHFVIISHGITCRMLLMRYFKWTVAEFEQLWNFENCEMAVLEKQPNGHYELITPLRRSKRKALAVPPISTAAPATLQAVATPAPVPKGSS